jgi:hypothetical protein
VGLVTKLQHWIGKLVKQVGGNPKHLRHDLELLNRELGENGPVPVEFFKDLVSARDSVIHGDSKATWTDGRTGKPRQIAEHQSFTGARAHLAELELASVQLSEASENAISQVEWYYEVLAKKNKLAEGGD